MMFAALALLATTPMPTVETVGEDAAACKSGSATAIKVTVQGLKDRTGELWLELYPDSKADFLRDDTDLTREGKTFRRTRGRIGGSGDVAICIRVPHPGRYALLLRHNRTGKDKFSFWSDGVGFRDARPIGRSRPDVAQAGVEAGAGVTHITIRMQYLRGLGGFGPR